MADIRVEIRDVNRNRIAEIDDYEKLVLIPRFNGVGTWVMDLNRASDKAPLLDPRAGSANPGGGVLIWRNGEIFFSGPIRRYAGSGDSETNKEGKLVVSGFDDNRHLQERSVWPVPANTFQTQGATAFYTVSGATTKMETLIRSVANVQAGPGARTERRIPGMVLAAVDSLRGTQTAYRGKFRFEPVIDALVEIAAQAPSGLSTPIGRGGLGFRVIQVETTLELQVYSITDRINSAKFTPEFENLISWEFSVDAPETTFLGVGAGRTAAFTNGPQVASNLYAYERTDDLFPTMRSESFLDVGEVDPAATDAQAQLDTSADQHFDTAAGQVGASFKVAATEGLDFKTHWDLGDYVTVVLPDITIQEQVRATELSYDADGDEQISVTVGTVDGAYKRRTPGLYRRINALSSKVAKLEVRQ